jgi:hypothetical protein
MNLRDVGSETSVSNSVQTNKIINKHLKCSTTTHIYLYIYIYIDGKTKCMLFEPKRKIRQIKNVYVKCYERVITSTEVV